MKLRKADISDIPQIQLIERKYYGSFSLPGEILQDWIKNLRENFTVAEQNGELIGCIAWERLEEIKAIPFFHYVSDFYSANGKYFYISEIGVLKNRAEMLNLLFTRVVKSARNNKIKGIIWVTGEDKSGHDSVERSLILRNGFRKIKCAGNWEYAPGKFSQNHWIYLKKM